MPMPMPMPNPAPPTAPDQGSDEHEPAVRTGFTLLLQQLPQTFETTPEHLYRYFEQNFPALPRRVPTLDPAYRHGIVSISVKSSRYAFINLESRHVLEAYLVWWDSLRNEQKQLPPPPRSLETGAPVRPYLPYPGLRKKKRMTLQRAHCSDWILRRMLGLEEERERGGGLLPWSIPDDPVVDEPNKHTNKMHFILLDWDLAQWSAGSELDFDPDPDPDPAHTPPTAGTGKGEAPAKSASAPTHLFVPSHTWSFMFSHPAGSARPLPYVYAIVHKKARGKARQGNSHLLGVAKVALPPFSRTYPDLSMQLSLDRAQSPLYDYPVLVQEWFVWQPTASAMRITFPHIHAEANLSAGPASISASDSISAPFLPSSSYQKMGDSTTRDIPISELAHGHLVPPSQIRSVQKMFKNIAFRSAVMMRASHSTECLSSSSSSSSL